MPCSCLVSHSHTNLRVERYLALDRRTGFSQSLIQRFWSKLKDISYMICVHIYIYRITYEIILGMSENGIDK